MKLTSLNTCFTIYMYLCYGILSIGRFHGGGGVKKNMSFSKHRKGISVLFLIHRGGGEDKYKEG